MKPKLFTLFLIAGFQINVKAQNPNLTFTLFSNGKLDSITGIVNAGDNRMFVVEQQGYIRILDSVGDVMSKPFLDIADEVGTMGNEEGLLGLAFSPNYKTNDYFFVYYTDPYNHIHIARFQVSSTNADSAIKSSEDTVLIVNHNPYQNHNGGNIAFGPDGYLYAGLGDGGYSSNGDPFNRAQNTDTLLGKMLRLDVSSLPYKIPPTNPFADGINGRPEIWAYGLRNPWCWSFDRLTADLWIGDVGQDLWEEVDFQPANDTGGENYGWRCYEGDAEYDYSLCSANTNFTFPVDTYAHSNSNGCCIIGGYVYRGAQYKSLFGKYLHSDLCSGRFWSIKDSAGIFKTTILNNFTANQITKFGQDIYGELYVGLREPGLVYKIGDTACAPVAFISFNDTVFVDTNGTISALYGQGLTYQWEFNNRAIIGNGNTVVADSAGTYTVIVTNGKCSSSASVSVELVTGINNPQTFKNLQIVPNPNAGAFDLKVSVPGSLSSTISIYDVLGRPLLTENTVFNGGKNTIHINGGNLSQGIYFLKINSQKGESVIKFVVAE
jgi:glucose/arabinose dehydrogenase